MSTYQNHSLGGSRCAVGLFAARNLKRHLSMFGKRGGLLNGLVFEVDTKETGSSTSILGGTCG